MTGVRERLRLATAKVHQNLHSAEPFARIARGAMDRSGYGRLLQSLYRYHAGMAGICDQGAALLKSPELGAAQRDRLKALAQDIDHFALPLPDVAVAEMPQAAFALGCLYTVLGSTLGGKVIYRQLDALLPEEQGRRFFRGTPQDSGHWQLLCAGLETQARHLDGITRGAHHAFVRFGALLAEEE